MQVTLTVFRQLVPMTIVLLGHVGQVRLRCALQQGGIGGGPALLGGRVVPERHRQGQQGPVGGDVGAALPVARRPASKARVGHDAQGIGGHRSTAVGHPGHARLAGVEEGEAEVRVLRVGVEEDDVGVGRARIGDGGQDAVGHEKQGGEGG